MQSWPQDTLGFSSLPNTEKKIWFLLERQKNLQMKNCFVLGDEFMSGTFNQCIFWNGIIDKKPKYSWFSLMLYKLEDRFYSFSSLPNLKKLTDLKPPTAYKKMESWKNIFLTTKFGLKKNLIWSRWSAKGKNSRNFIKTHLRLGKLFLLEIPVLFWKNFVKHGQFWHQN